MIAAIWQAMTRAKQRREQGSMKGQSSRRAQKRGRTAEQES